MKKVVLLILFLSACSPLATPLPTATFIELSTAAPTLTETLTPTLTSISTPVPILEPISGGWSTFHSSEYGFSFQYPAVYDDGFYDPADPLSFCNIQTKKEDGKFNIWVGYVWIVIDKTTQDLGQITDTFLQEKSVEWSIVSQEQIEVNNLPVIMIEYTHETPDRGGVQAFLIHNEDLFTVNYYEALFGDCGPLDTGYSSYWVFSQIIGTLKFNE